MTRSGFAVAYDSARHVVVLFGGTSRANADEAVDQTWLWDGATWRQVDAGRGAPPARTGHSMAFDATRGKVVLFGGAGCSACPQLADTWEWDGTAWSAAAASGPSARSWAAMAFDPRREKTVLFGGWRNSDPDAGAPGPLADTWELDAAGWRLAAPPAAPAGRAAAAATYDARLGAVVIHGGYSRLLPPRLTVAYGDTWAYDGATWRSVAAESDDLSRRFFAMLVHDPARRATVLFAGIPYIGARANGDTWELGGDGWISRGPSGQYPAKYAIGAAAFDAARRRVVYVVDDGLGLQTLEYHGFAEPCSADADCDTGSCNGGICCEQACGVCSDCVFTGLSCAPVAERDDRESCTGTMTCDALARCAKKPGQACRAGAECASGLCTGGTCCRVDGCGAFACGTDGLCRTSCASAAECAAGATCAGGVCAPSAGTCEGDVAVTSTGVRTACSPFACSPQGCIAACGTSDDCAAGYLCGAGGACVAAGRGAVSGCATGGGGDGALAGILVAGVAAAAMHARRRRRAR